MKTFTSGARSSEEAPRYDLLEPACLKRMAARMAHGAASHGAKNYRKGKGDATFRQDRINHLIGHCLAYAAGETSEDHLGAVLANANILSYLDEAKPTHDELHLLSVKCKCGTDCYPGPICLGCHRKKKR